MSSEAGLCDAIAAALQRDLKILKDDVESRKNHQRNGSGFVLLSEAEVYDMLKASAATIAMLSKELLRSAINESVDTGAALEREACAKLVDRLAEHTMKNARPTDSAAGAEASRVLTMAAIMIRARRV